MRTRRAAFVAGTAAIAAGFALPAPSVAQPDESIPLELHGAYYSHRLQIVPAVDPQVFVTDPSVTVGGIGLENIEHVAGLRALRLDGSDADAPLYSAEGMHLGFTASRWLHARGTCTLAPGGESMRLTLHASGLIAFGVYSVFKRLAGASGDVDVPLDGTGKRNSFRAGADGSASLALVSPQPLDPHGLISLVYHSDGRTHGMSTGELGVDAHQQLVALAEKT